MKFLKGALLLALAGIICRLLGVVVRIPLANIVGNYGMGLYQMVFPLYALLLIISSAGIPVALSKLIASNKASPKQILFNAVLLMTVVGAIVSALFMLFAYNIAALQGNRAVGIIYMAIAPAVLLVCVLSAFRGYFQGAQNMLPTATSQIIEQLVKLAFALGLALWFIKTSVVLAVFGAILAVTISEAVALVYLIILYALHHKKDKSKFSFKISFPLIWQIIKTAVPITLMASIFPLILVMDSMFIINMLHHAGASHHEATQLFGISSGTVHTLVNLPAVLGAAVATAVVPCVSKLKKENQTEQLRKSMSHAIQITVLVSIFFTVFYLVFAQTIVDLLYHNAFRAHGAHLVLAGRLLMIESALIFLMAASAVFTAMLQGLDRARFPLIALLVGGAVKIAFQFAFIGQLGIYAVSIANVLCFALAALINTIFALRALKIPRCTFANLARLVALTTLFALAVRLSAMAWPDNRWLLLAKGALALGLYLILLALFRFLRFNRSNVGNNLQQK